MRTTLTLDDDVAAALERLRRARDASLKDVVNEVLRGGLSELAARPPRALPNSERGTRTTAISEHR